MKKEQHPPEKGDLVRVEWVDIAEDSSGDPDLGDLSHRVSIGFFWKRAISKHRQLPIIVTTTTIEMASDQIQDSGYCAYPESCILKMTVVKRAPKSRKKKHEKDGS